jgi:hypothetical protein
MAMDQMMWLINKGDVVLSDRPREVFQLFDVEFTEATRKPEFLTIYSYPEDENLPDTYEIAHTGSSFDLSVQFNANYE